MTPASELCRVRIDGAPPSVEWAVGRDVAVPRELLGGVTGNTVDLRALPPPPMRAAADLRLRAAFTDTPPLSSRLPFSYQRVPARLRSLIARRMGRRHGREGEWAQFPGWPLDLSADMLADWALDLPSSARQPAPVLLTHDIDSPEGLRNLVDRFLPIAEAHGASITAYVVPCAWPLDHGLLREVAARGHAVGVHGYDHANRTPFAGDTERRRRIAAGREALAAYGPRGYRAPSLLRTARLLADLAPHYGYDTSIPTAGGPFPVPNNGCASARPFRVGATLELPVTLPRDGSLLYLGYSPVQILGLWTSLAADIAASGGIVVLLTHCEERFSGSPAMLETLSGFLEAVARSRLFTWSTPEQVARDAP